MSPPWTHIWTRCRTLTTSETNNPDTVSCRGLLVPIVDGGEKPLISLLAGAWQAIPRPNLQRMHPLMFVNGQTAERILPVIAAEYPFQILFLGACDLPADVSRIRSLSTMEFKIQAIHPECGTPCKGCLHEMITALRNGAVVALAAQDEQTLRRWHRMITFWMAEAV